MRPVMLAFAALLILSGCGAGRIQPGTWLAAFDSDTITVSDACRAWQRFDDEQRALYGETDSTGRRLVRNLALHGILTGVAGDAGYLDDPGIASFRASWLRTEASIAWSEAMLDSMSEIDPADRDYCAGHVDDVLWLSAAREGSAPSDLGMLRRVDLPHDLALQLDSTAGGGFDTEYDGLLFRLDSVAAVDPGELGLVFQADGSADSSIWWGIHQSRLRFWNLTTQIRLNADYGVSIDTAAVVRLAAYYAGTGPLSPSDTLLRSGLVNCTALEVTREIEFFQTRFPLRADMPAWVLSTLDNILMQDYEASLLASEYPAVFDSLSEEAFEYAVDIALDSMYSDSIAAFIPAVTEAQIRFEFDNLEQAVTIPEKRILRAVEMPQESVGSYERAIADGSLDRFLASQPGMPEFASGDPSGATRPLMESELPEGHGAEVFGLAEGDTSWVGPLPLDSFRGRAFYRVLQILPEHAAGLEEIRPELEVAARTRLESEAVDRWLTGLASKHGLVLNDRILDRLPDDPGSWDALP